MEEITSVSLYQVEQIEKTDYVLITFILYDFSYCLTVRKNEEGVFVPQHIAHYINKLGSKCHYCGGSMGTCSMLTFAASTLFQRLIEHRSIRLFWVTNTYESNTKPIDYTG